MLKDLHYIIILDQMKRMNENEKKNEIEREKIMLINNNNNNNNKVGKIIL